MATRKPPKNGNNHLEEAMALLIRNQAAFVEQIARTDQERLELRRKSEEMERKSGELERKTDERFARIEERFARIETILLQLPDVIRQKIGFKAQK